MLLLRGGTTQTRHEDRGLESDVNARTGTPLRNRDLRMEYVDNDALRLALANTDPELWLKSHEKVAANIHHHMAAEPCTSRT